jgi:hypothetical protein
MPETINLNLSAFDARVKVMQAINSMRQAIVQMPEKVRGQAMQNALRAGLRVIGNDAKRRVAVDDGSLKRSIRISTKVGRGYGDMSAALKAGGKGNKQAGLIEYGWKGKGGGVVAARPYMRPAFVAASDAAVEKVRQNIADRLKKEYGFARDT